MIENKVESSIKSKECFLMENYFLQHIKKISVIKLCYERARCSVDNSKAQCVMAKSVLFLQIFRLHPCMKHVGVGNIGRLLEIS